MHRLQQWLLVGTLALGAQSSGCAGTLEDPERFSAVMSAETCAEPVPTILARSCGTGGCHSTADKAQGLDLQSPGVAERLRGANAAGGGKLIDPAEPARSVLYTKLMKAPPFGGRMPYGAQAFDDATLACVLSWVSAQGRGATAD